MYLKKEENKSLLKKEENRSLLKKEENKSPLIKGDLGGCYSLLHPGVGAYCNKPVLSLRGHKFSLREGVRVPAFTVV